MAIHTQCACTRVRRAARALTDHYDRALAPAGLKVTQFSVLRTIARLEPVSVSALAAEMALDRSTLGRNLTLLKRARLVRMADGDDLREWAVSLTAAGRRAVEQAVPLWEGAQAQVRTLLGGSSVQALFEMLSKVEELR